MRCMGWESSTLVTKIAIETLQKNKHNLKIIAQVPRNKVIEPARSTRIQTMNHTQRQSLST